MAAVRVYIPPANEKTRQVTPHAPLGIPEDDHFFPKDVFHDGETYRACHTDTDCGFSVVVEVGNEDKSLWGAVQPIYLDYIPMLDITDGTYRPDIGEHAEQDLMQLSIWGYDIPKGWERPPEPMSQRGRTRLTGRNR